MDQIRRLGTILANKEENLAKRFRALFTLRNIICQESIDEIGKVLLKDESALLKHECAYCMGQMKDKRSLPYLVESIKDEKEHPMVRHEAGEALGAIGEINDEIMDILKHYANHKVRELAETCNLALDRLKYYSGDKSSSKKVAESSLSPYDTVDPTPAYPNTMPLEELKKIYLDEKETLFNRYKALFTLRNINTAESIAIICEGFFVSPEDSALFKHEVAFVLGQIQSIDSVDALSKKLSDLQENDMVRHECAEALGSIGQMDVIKNYLEDKSRIVSESCQVALDIASYYNDNQQFDFFEDLEVI